MIFKADACCLDTLQCMTQNPNATAMLYQLSLFVEERKIDPSCFVFVSVKSENFVVSSTPDKTFFFLISNAK